MEHVLPQAWREHWAGDIASEDQEHERDALVHTLGNLTLVNNKLNPALSNRPWTDQEAQERGLGQSGKRTELAKHSTLKLNADLVHTATSRWDHDLIRARTADLTQAVLEIWPVPEKLAPQSSPASMEREAPQETAEPAGKYSPLTQWLLAQTENELPATFDDLEEKLGAPLAPTARGHSQYWYSTANSLGKALAAGGFKASGVNLTEERLILRRR